MRAINEKWETVKEVALRKGISRNTVDKWHSRGWVPSHRIIDLIDASRGELALEDFRKQDDDVSTRAPASHP